MPVGGYSPDVLTRIYNMQWGGGVVVAGEINTSNVYYLKTDDITDANPAPWQNLGTLDFKKYEGDMFTGWVQGSSYAVIDPDNPIGPDNPPVFLLVGGGGIGNAKGIIMASPDGLNWNRVFSFGTNSDTFVHANIFGVVWSDSDKCFYAGGHQSDSYGLDSGFKRTETDILFMSPDGYSWSEIKRVVLTSTVDPPVSLPAYPNGLLSKHCSTMVVDQFGSGIPDGYYKYDEKNQIMITPTAIPSIDYQFGQVSEFVGTDVTINQENPSPTTARSDPGFPVNCVCLAGNNWIAAGGTFLVTDDGLGGGTCKAALLVPSFEEQVFDWTSLDPGGRSMICTITGGLT